jgi:antitoxin (DNA-binding transcriptional repressor) of toxin-antitoxin stability system
MIFEISLPIAAHALTAKKERYLKNPGDTTSEPACSAMALRGTRHVKVTHYLQLCPLPIVIHCTQVAVPKGLLMPSVTLEEAQARLSELIATLKGGEELVISQDGSPIAKLTRTRHTRRPRQPGSAAHIPHWMAPDFDAPLEDFREYME